LVQVLIAVLPITSAFAQSQPLNGSSPRPFYVFAHNPNTLDDVRAALDAGANALEPDITRAPCNFIDLLQDLVTWDSDFPNGDGECTDTKLTEWLDGVHDLAMSNRQLALIVFDVKSPAALPIFGPLILDAIRNHLNIGDVDISVIISVGTRDDLAVFDRILTSPLRPREGVMVDAEDQVGDVVSSFFARGYRGNIGYGDGTSAVGPHLFPAMDAAVWSRAVFGDPKAIPYVYTINLEGSMKAFIDVGVDGIITDDIGALARIVRERSDVRLARREDNPFLTSNETYGLTVRTGDDGTDANITFTLHGSLGNATTTVNTFHIGRMEHGDTNLVTIPSADLGALQSITVTNDGTGNGPDWILQDVTVHSGHWLKKDLSYHFTATLNDTLSGGSSKTLPFRVDEFVWSGFAAVSDGTSTNPRKRLGDASAEGAPGGTIHLAAGRYGEKLTLTKPCTLKFWGDHGSTPAVIGLQ
jgi:hypothetical protein